jgi:hypothetical protein
MADVFVEFHFQLNALRLIPRVVDARSSDTSNVTFSQRCGNSLQRGWFGMASTMARSLLNQQRRGRGGSGGGGGGTGRTRRGGPLRCSVVDEIAAAAVGPSFANSFLAAFATGLVQGFASFRQQIVNGGQFMSFGQWL